MAETATIHPINKGAAAQVSPSDSKTSEPQQHPSDDQKSKIAKPKLTRILPTNRATVDKQLLLARAYTALYASTNEPVSIRQVADVAKMDRTAISLANGFLVDVGILAKIGTGFAPTQETIAFNHAYEWNAETAPHKLATLFQRHWATQKLMPLLTLGALSEEQAVRELAADSNAQPENKTQLRMLLEFLERTGIVRRQGDSYLRGSISSSRPDAATENDSAVAPVAAPSHNEPPPQREQPARSGTTTTFNQMTAGAVQFSINVKVDVTELAGWEADRIKALFAGIAQVLAAKADVEQDLDV